MNGGPDEQELRLMIASAMAHALLANPTSGDHLKPEHIAEAAYAVADALLAPMKAIGKGAGKKP